MDAYYSDDFVTIFCSDCRAVMRDMPENSVDAIVTDPPYGLGFMGKDWDHGVPGETFWREALRVAKPGAHLLAFGGTRTHHRLMVAIEDAGWEIRDCLGWLYGSGLPKSLDVSYAIDKEAGAVRSDRRVAEPQRRRTLSGAVVSVIDDGTPVTPAAQAWQGWGTALKPAWEPIVMARKPLDGRVVACVQTWGTGAVNIDACRVPADDRQKGRWPANIVHDGSDDVLGIFPDASNRFFYCAKATHAEKDEGLESKKNHHPTVKPVALMRWLVRLVTPPNGVVFDPFAGSGTTLKAARLEGFRSIGCEIEEEYCEIALARLRQLTLLRGGKDDE
jgi:site-specific DNA-methyltransferase (adenine-specific)